MSQRDADTFISKNEREFILKALSEDCRLDGRRPYDLRKPKFQFSLDDRSATVALGTTRVLSVVTASLEAPFPDKPSEGVLRFHVDFSPMASPAFEPGRQGEDAVQVARLIERGLRQSGAVDQEALCVVAGRKVWVLRVDCRVLDNGGNVLDAAFLSALAALLAFRKPEVEVGGESGTEIVVHPPEVREPLPLTLHHLPVSITFSLFQGGDLLVVDPTLKEAAAASGSCTVIMNPGREVCCVHKADGIGLTPDQFMRCIRLAADKTDQLVKELKVALEQHEVARVQARVRRHQQVVGLPDPAARHVMILGAKEPAAGAPPGAATTASASTTPGGRSSAAAATTSGKSAIGVDDLDEDDDIDEEDEDDEDEKDEDEDEKDEDEDGKDEDEKDEDEDGKDEDEDGDEMEGEEGRKTAKGEGKVGRKHYASGSGGSCRGKDAAGPRDMEIGEAAEAPKQQQQRARLSGPLVSAPKEAAGTGVGKRGLGKGGGGVGPQGVGALLGANKRGKDNVRFDELEAIAAVIAGVPAGGPRPGEPEPDLAAAIKPGKLRKSGASKKG